MYYIFQKWSQRQKELYDITTAYTGRGELSFVNSISGINDEQELIKLLGGNSASVDVDLTNVDFILPENKLRYEVKQESSLTFRSSDSGFILSSDTFSKIRNFCSTLQDSLKSLDEQELRRLMYLIDHDEVFFKMLSLSGIKDDKTRDFQGIDKLLRGNCSIKRFSNIVNFCVELRRARGEKKRISVTLPNGLIKELPVSIINQFCSYEDVSSSIDRLNFQILNRFDDDLLFENDVLLSMFNEMCLASVVFKNIDVLVVVNENGFVQIPISNIDDYVKFISISASKPNFRIQKTLLETTNEKERSTDSADACFIEFLRTDRLNDLEKSNEESIEQQVQSIACI